MQKAITDLVEELIEIRFSERDDFLKIKETLTRIGIPSTSEGDKLYQTCHILHKRGQYYIVHFKELFGLDGRDINMSEDDVLRKHKISQMLQEWGLVRLVKQTNIEGDVAVKIIGFKEKHKWELIPKYKMGV